MAAAALVADTRLLTALETEFKKRRSSTSLLTKLVDINEYLRSYGSEMRDFYYTERDRQARRLVPIGWHFYRQDNIDALLERIRAEINPVATLTDLTELLEIVFHQYQAQIVANPLVELSDHEVAARVNEMNCKTVLMYGRKFKLQLAGVFDWQQYRRHPGMHALDARNYPEVISERDNRRDQYMNLPPRLVLRRSGGASEALKKRAAYQVAHDDQFARRVTRALDEPSSERSFRPRNTVGIYRSRQARVFRELYP